MIYRDHFDSSNIFATDPIISMACTPPWGRLQNHSHKQRYKTMSLDGSGTVIITDDAESDAKEGGYSLANEQIK